MDPFPKISAYMCFSLVLQAGTIVIQGQDTVNKDPHPTAAPHRARAESAAKKPKAPAKPPTDPDAVFPCKKCGRYEEIMTLI